MTKKDFEFIAGILRVNYRKDFTSEELSLFESLARYFAYQLESKYPKFDKEKFLVACGIESRGITQ